MLLSDRKKTIKAALIRAGNIWVPKGKGYTLNKYVDYLIQGNEYQSILLTPTFARAFFGTKDSINLWEDVIEAEATDNDTYYTDIIIPESDITLNNGIDNENKNAKSSGRDENSYEYYYNRSKIDRDRVYKNYNYNKIKKREYELIYKKLIYKNLNINGSKDIIEQKYCNKCGSRIIIPIWEYHLKNMVMCDCVEYIRRYLECNIG